MKRPRSLLPQAALGLGLVLAACSGDTTEPPLPATGPASFSFTARPAEVAIGELFDVVVAVLDSSGNVVASAPQPLSLTVLDDQLQEKLTVEAPITGGSARFTGLRINELGEGFTLRADFASLSASDGPIETFLPFLQIDAGRRHTCAVADAHIRPDGTEIPAGVVYCWGRNSNGQVQPLTRGSLPFSTRPIPASGDNRLGNPALQVVTGAEHTCSRLETREAFCWGSDARGQMGSGSTGPNSGGTLLTGFSFLSLIAGRDHTCGTTLPTMSGNVVCWGLNNVGQIDVTVTSNPMVPTRVNGLVGATRIAPGQDHSCAAFASDTRCWGWNIGSLLGHGGTSNDSTHMMRIVAGSAVFTELSAGWLRTCGLDDQGRAWCWGENLNGQLGDGSTVDANHPVLAAAPAGIRFSRIEVGLSHTCAIDTSDVAYCWGANGVGQTGTGTGSPQDLVPTPVAGNLRFLEVVTGSGHTCGVTVTRRVYCWGFGREGRLGNGDVQDATVPVAVR